jgi:hypothetical protein
MSGGSGNEVVKCMVHDDSNQLIIVGGNTVSSDYGPSVAQLGFMYAVDLLGNWKWGNYFYSTTSISDITGCSLSTDSKLLVAMGLRLGQPVLLTLSKQDGKIKSVLSLDTNLPNAPSIKAFGALLFDNLTRSFAPVFIVSYISNEKLQMASVT